MNHSSDIHVSERRNPFEPRIPTAIQGPGAGVYGTAKAGRYLFHVIIIFFLTTEAEFTISHAGMFQERCVANALQLH